MMAVMRFEEADAEAKAKALSPSGAKSERITKAEKEGVKAAPSSWALGGGGSEAKLPRTVSWKEGTVDNEREPGEPDFATRVAMVRERAAFANARYTNLAMTVLT